MAVERNELLRTFPGLDQCPVGAAQQCPEDRRPDVSLFMTLKSAGNREKVDFCLTGRVRINISCTKINRSEHQNHLCDADAKTSAWI